MLVSRIANERPGDPIIVRPKKDRRQPTSTVAAHVKRAMGDDVVYAQAFDFAIDLPEETWRDLFQVACDRLAIDGAHLVAASGRNAIIRLTTVPDAKTFKRLESTWGELLRREQVKHSKAEHGDDVQRLAEEIERRWSTVRELAPLFASGLAAKAAYYAALEVIAEHPAGGRSPLAVVDDATGLALPPPLRTPYQQRGQNEHGRRRDVIEHIQHEYGDYLEAGLFTIGFLFENDRPAYNALNYKASRAVEEAQRGETIQDYCLRHGILTREHLLHPPKRFVRQVAILRKAQALLSLRRLGTGNS